MLLLYNMKGRCILTYVIQYLLEEVLVHHLGMLNANINSMPLQCILVLEMKRIVSAISNYF